MSSNRISVTGLSKSYKMYKNPQNRMREFFRVKGKSTESDEFRALKDISFHVEKGETVGIIGRNGSGKSTLLQVICGVLEPTKGNVTTNGRIAALLELGAGFNPEFTGRENVFFNASILGLSKSEIESRFSDIEQFADIGIFIDQPVKTYSSGMYARLAFAVAINVTPDILVVDEALAVGDEMFQRKCFARINEIKKAGATILFVSHSGSSIINLCDKALLLHNGHLLYQGAPKKAVYFHQKLGNAQPHEVDRIVNEIVTTSPTQSIETLEEEKDPAPFESQSSTAPQIKKGKLVEKEEELQEFFDKSLVPESTFHYDAKGISIVNWCLQTQDGRVINQLYKGKRYKLIMEIAVNEDCSSVRSYALIRTKDGIDLAGCAYPVLQENGFDCKKGEKLKLSFDFHCMLNDGVYFCNFALQAKDGSLHHRIVDALAFRVWPDLSSPATGLVDLNYIPEKENIVHDFKAA